MASKKATNSILNSFRAGTKQKLVVKNNNPTLSPSPIEAPTPDVHEEVATKELAQVTDAPATSGQLTPYRFKISEKKGKKALIRFRENLRRFYPNCPFTDEGLKLNDNPVLELYCYDPKTDIGYCRLASAKHDGPIFKNPKQLYACYNCSNQGNPDDVFVYSAEGDEDDGLELTAFLREIEILTPDQFSEQYLELFQDAVKNNVLLNSYAEAVEKKRTAKKQTKKGDPSAVQEIPGPPSNLTEQALVKEGVVLDEAKESPRRVTQKKRVDPPPNKADDKIVSQPGPLKKFKCEGATLVDLQVDESSLENSMATFVYQRTHVRLGDLPPESMERSTMCWSIFSHLLKTQPAALGEAIAKQHPGQSAEDILGLAKK
uniref:Uncharacterized protein n=1 Tax=viral metagenome TaxID=1070528 RepID=A0A6C0BNK0_9ZZZZ